MLRTSHRSSPMNLFTHDSQVKQNSAKNSTIWSAASVFSKKFKKWKRQDQKIQNPKKQDDKEQNFIVPNQLDRFQIGRRSCDIAPRFSLDGCRLSLDQDPLFSFDDPPRASCDVHFKPGGIIPGGTSLTREYYADSSSRRKPSFDHSVSIRKMTSAFMEETTTKGKVSPATVLIENSEILKVPKKSRKWMNGFNFWGFILHRRSKRSEDSGGGDGGGGGEEGGSVMSVSWPEVRKVEEKAFNPMMLRSKSSISFRNSYEFVTGINGNGNGKKIVLERNKSARCSSMENSSRWRGGSVMRMY